MATGHKAARLISAARRAGIEEYSAAQYARDAAYADMPPRHKFPHHSRDDGQNCRSAQQRDAGLRARARAPGFLLAEMRLLADGIISASPRRADGHSAEDASCHAMPSGFRHRRRWHAQRDAAAYFCRRLA